MFAAENQWLELKMTFPFDFWPISRCKLLVSGRFFSSWMSLGLVVVACFFLPQMFLATNKKMEFFGRATD